MEKLTITHSETGEYQGWFDPHKALRFEEDTWWNGHDNISRATGSQWNHERLFYSRRGRWVLRAWSQWQGTTDTVHEISEAEAICWLLAQSCDPDDIAKLPDAVQQRIAAATAEKEH